MVMLRIESCNTIGAKAEILIEYSAEIIDLTVIHKEQQFDFTLDKSEWELIKLLIDTAIQQEKRVKLC